MTWAKRYGWRLVARSSLVLWGGLALLLALLISPMVRSLDEETNWRIFGFSPDGARAVLGILVGSMLTFIVFVLSATLIVVQLASSQMTPRVIGIVLTTPWMKFSVSILTFTYTYTLSAVARVEDRVPELHVGVAVFLNLACIVVFFYFVQRLSTGLRPASLMLLVGDRAKRAIEQVYPLTYDPKHPELESKQGLTSPSDPITRFSGTPGVVMAFNAKKLIQLAQESDAIIELLPQVGDFLATEEPLFRIQSGRKPIAPSTLEGCVAVGNERTMDQDPRFGFRILVDIASKALSPAINDPSTAVLALDQITNLLLCLGKRHLDEGEGHDRNGNLRLIYGTPDWPDFVILAISEIRQFGEGSLQVNRRLRAMLEYLIEVLPEIRRPPLQKELEILTSGVERMFPAEEDRKRARIADNQGVGGSES